MCLRMSCSKEAALYYFILDPSHQQNHNWQVLLMPLLKDTYGLNSLSAQCWKVKSSSSSSSSCTAPRSLLRVPSDSYGDYHGSISRELMKKLLWFFVTIDEMRCDPTVWRVASSTDLRRARRPGVMTWLKATAGTPEEGLLANGCWVRHHELFIFFFQVFSSFFSLPLRNQPSHKCGSQAIW